jgi:hypothetical protein
MHVPSGWNNRCRTPLVGPLFERRLIRDFDQVGGVWRGLGRSAFWVCPRYIAVPGQEDFRRASAFLDSYRVLPGENYPLHFEVGVSPGKVQNRATGPISMSSQWAPRQSRRFTRVKSRTDSIAAPRELLRRSGTRSLLKVALEFADPRLGGVIRSIARKCLGSRQQDVKWVLPRSSCR